MNLYLISQTVNDGYDTYDSAVVAAKSPKEASRIHPGGQLYQKEIDDLNSSVWTAPDRVSVKLLGTAVKGQKAGVICASFNAG